MIEVEAIIAINKWVCAKSKEPFLVRNHDLLESALHSAFYPGEAPYQHGCLQGVVSALGYSIIKNHCFENGNKRTASFVMLAIYKKHGYEIVYPGTSLADIVTEVASSTPSDVDMIRAKLRDWLEIHKVQNQKLD